MGNLRPYMPITFITFAVGWLAIAAVPPLSGFWAKGDVLENTWAAHPALWVVGVVTAALTAYYMSRLTGLAFFGKDRWSQKVPIDAATDMPDAHHAEGPSPSPTSRSRIMTIPLWILAFFAAIGRRPGAVQRPPLAVQLDRPGVRVQPLQTTTSAPAPSGCWPSSTP